MFLVVPIRKLTKIDSFSDEMNNLCSVSQENSMKKISTVAVAAILSTGLYTAPAHSYDNVAKAMCNYIVADHKSRFRDQLRSNKIKLKKVYKQISCNGHSLLRFAMTNDADNVGKFIVKRLPASLLKKAESDGVTVFDWAKANGKEASAIAQAVKARAKL